MARTDEGVGNTPGEAHTRTDDERYEAAARQVQDAEDDDLEYRISEWDESRAHRHAAATENDAADDYAVDTQSPTQLTGTPERGAVPPEDDSRHQAAEEQLRAAELGELQCWVATRDEMQDTTYAANEDEVDIAVMTDAANNPRRTTSCRPPGTGRDRRTTTSTRRPTPTFHR